MPAILVTGALGQVGQELQFHQPQYPDWSFTFIDRAEVDLTEPGAIQQFFADHHFDFCINCAAYTAVDRAETEAELATAVNTRAVEWLTEACRQRRCRLIHLSTDYVYHNALNRPLLETDPTHPKSVYARTKLAGDLLVRERLPEAWVVRTSWVYSTYGHNFVKTMLRLGRERDELGIVYDQVGTPTYARHLARALLRMIARVVEGQEQAGGIYHYSNEGVCSWYDFALAIFAIEGIDCRVRPILTSAYPTPARRPPFSLLNKQKICRDFDLSIPHWRTGLTECLAALRLADQQA
ncbi:MAG: dTDP-4-dehydrorhamnose reductase [Bacteroidota bacterium]